MTISSVRTRELSIDQIVRRAWQVAGLFPPDGAVLTEGQLSLGRDLLEALSDSLVTEGLFARTVDWYELPLEAGTHIYTMPDTTSDVVGTAMWIADGESLTQASGERQVKPIDRATYQTISAKSTSGQPTMYYMHRVTAPPQVYLWPIPSETATIRFQVQKLLADCDSGTATPDVERFWVRGIIWALAAEIASSQSLPGQTVVRLEGKAEALLQKARSYANQNVNIQFRLGHSTPWSR